MGRYKAERDAIKETIKRFGNLDIVKIHKTHIYTANPKIPINLIIHGSSSESLYNQGIGVVIRSYNKWNIIKYINKYNETVQFGFLDDNITKIHTPTNIGVLKLIFNN